METSSLSKLNWVVIARAIYPFYFLAAVSDIFIHQPPYQIAENRPGLNYQFFGLLLGWLPLLILITVGAERARQLLPASSRSVLNSLGLLALFASSGMKNAFTLALFFLPSHSLFPSPLSTFLQAIIVLIKWTGFGFFAFARLPSTTQSFDSVQAQKLKRSALTLLTLLLIAIALRLLIQDIRGLVVSQ